jgi:hypothetical protein
MAGKERSMGKDKKDRNVANIRSMKSAALLWMPSRKLHATEYVPQFCSA